MTTNPHPENAGPLGRRTRANFDPVTMTFRRQIRINHDVDAKVRADLLLGPLQGKTYGSIVSEALEFFYKHHPDRGTIPTNKEN